ncbi:hypothetical protein [Moorena producens]|uniref:hypothetical protein n=1 Tax=Moorena producens TaxID=1155739 RepID=UPI0011EA6435|nr:hypothetical protein [Moorena producens]
MQRETALHCCFLGCISSFLLFDPVGRMGILVECASWWNGHLGGTGILPVSIFGRAVSTRGEEV